MTRVLAAPLLALALAAGAGCSSDEKGDTGGHDAAVNTDSGDQTVAEPDGSDATADASNGDASVDAAADVALDVSPPDPCLVGGPDLPDPDGPMKLVVYTPGDFMGISFLTGVYELASDTRPDVCIDPPDSGASDAGPGNQNPLVFDVPRTDGVGTTVRVRFDNNLGNFDIFPPVKDDYSATGDYLVFEIFTTARIDDQIASLTIGAGGAGLIYRDSFLEGSVAADLEETGRLDGQFKLLRSVVSGVPLADGGASTQTVEDLICLWVVGDCRIPPG